MRKAKKPVSFTVAAMKADMESLRELKAGKAFESVKGLKKVDTRFYETPEMSRAARKSVNMSQAEFARLMGVSVQTVQSWETARRRPVGLVNKVFKLIAEDPALLERLASV